MVVGNLAGRCYSHAAISRITEVRQERFRPSGNAEAVEDSVCLECGYQVGWWERRRLWREKVVEVIKAKAELERIFQE